MCGTLIMHSQHAYCCICQNFVSLVVQVHMLGAAGGDAESVVVDDLLQRLAGLELHLEAVMLLAMGVQLLFHLLIFAH